MFEAHGHNFSLIDNLVALLNLKKKQNEEDGKCDIHFPWISHFSKEKPWRSVISLTKYVKTMPWISLLNLIMNLGKNELL